MVAAALLAGCPRSKPVASDDPSVVADSTAAAVVSTLDPDTAREISPPEIPPNRIPDESRPRDTARARDSAPASPPPAPRPESVPGRIARRFPAATGFVTLTEPFSHGRVLDRHGVIGYEVDTDEAGTTQDGYAGPIPMIIWFDAQGRVTEVKILGNDETPGYLQIIFNSGLLDSLKGYSAAAPESVDVITLATKSAKAMIDATRLTADIVDRELVPR